MDQNQNNQNPSQTGQQIPTEQVSETQSQTQNMPVENQPPETSNENKNLMVVVMIVAILAIVAFVFLLFSQSSQNPSTTIPQRSQVSIPLPTVVLSQEERDAENVKVEEVESDIKNIEQDASQL